MPMQIQTVTFSEPKDGNASAEWQDGASGGVVGDGTATPRRARFVVLDGATGAYDPVRWVDQLVRSFAPQAGGAEGPRLERAAMRAWFAEMQDQWAADVRDFDSIIEERKFAEVGSFATLLGFEIHGLDGPEPYWRAVALGDRFPSGSASAVRAARPGGYRADAATEPDDGAPRRHHLVVGIGIAVLRRVQARATWARATRARASRIRAPRTAGTGRRRHRAGLRDRAPDRRRRWPRVRHRDRRTGRRRLGHLAARHRGRDQTARPDVTPSRLRYQVTQINHIARINHANIGNIWNLYSIWCR